MGDKSAVFLGLVLTRAVMPDHVARREVANQIKIESTHVNAPYAKRTDKTDLKSFRSDHLGETLAQCCRLHCVRRARKHYGSFSQLGRYAAC
jgi:hypothetical protein